MTDFCGRLSNVLNNRSCDIENESDYFTSAVLVPLVRQNGKLGVLFEVRSSGLNWLMVNFLLVLFYAFWLIWKKRNLKGNLPDLLIVSIFGIYGLVAVQLFPNKFLD